LFAGGIIPALIFGVAFGNLLLGIPFHFDDMLKSTYTGSFWGLLTPFALLSGLVSVAMLLNHGATWLQLKTDGVIYQRAQSVSVYLSLSTVILFILAGIYLSLGVDGYVITSKIDTLATSNPMNKDVTVQAGAWLANYSKYPWMVLAPLAAILAGLGCSYLSIKNKPGLAFIASSVVIAGVILTAGFSMFPFLLPSSTMPQASLTLWDATSSLLTLKIMFFVACIFVPLILAYTTYSYYVMRGRIKQSDLNQSHTSY
jgi:cytochrome d ubiquinol oxidase subunit II